MDMNKNFDAFDNYFMKFDIDNEHNIYKYHHSYRVMSECENIAKSLFFDEESINLAALIGLLHDIGRFYQTDKYATFSDSNSLDHAQLGAKILFEDNLIKEFDVNKEDYDIIEASIVNHNKLTVDNSIKDDALVFSNIVRDADKLDIIYAFTNKKLELKEDDKEINKTVKETFYKRKLIDNNLCLSLNDQVIKILSYIFDLNFDYSYKKILESKYLDIVYKNLKNKKIFKEYFDEIKKYLKKKVKEEC